MDSYCERCGTMLVNGVCPNCCAAQTAPVYQANAGNPYSRIFATPNEKFVTSLGGNNIQNFLNTGRLNKCFVVVSNKRLYFMGKDYGILTARKVSQIVDLEDIAGSKITKSTRPMLLACGIALLILSIITTSTACDHSRYNNNAAQTWAGILWFLTVILFVLYFSTIRRTFEVSFAGGSIYVPIKWYSDDEIQVFHNTLRSVIEREKSNSEYT